MARLNSLDKLTQNKKTVLFGNQGDNLMGSLETFKLVYNNNNWN
jgi:hypothetical protein